MTPMMVRGLPSRTMACPTMWGLEANLRFQSPSEIITVGFAPSRSSSAVKVRPSIGVTPSISKKPADTMLPAEVLGLARSGELRIAIAIGHHCVEATVVALPVEKVQIGDGASGEVGLVVEQNDQAIWRRDRAAD
jgi:hypothetical protein